MLNSRTKWGLIVENMKEKLIILMIISQLWSWCCLIKHDIIYNNNYNVGIVAGS